MHIFLFVFLSWSERKHTITPLQHGREKVQSRREISILFPKKTNLKKLCVKYKEEYDKKINENKTTVNFNENRKNTQWNYQEKNILLVQFEYITNSVLARIFYSLSGWLNIFDVQPEQLGGLGARCKRPQWGPGAKP